MIREKLMSRKRGKIILKKYKKISNSAKRRKIFESEKWFKKLFIKKIVKKTAY